MTDQGLYLHVAVAGSGKTRSLIQRARDLLSEERDDPANTIVVCTYTREAAEELRSRIVDERLTGQVGRRLMVGTLHSIAVQIVNSLRSLQHQSPLRLQGAGRLPFRLVEAVTNVLERANGLAEQMRESGCQTDPVVLARRLATLVEIIPIDVSVTPEIMAAYVRSRIAAEFTAVTLNHWRDLCETAPLSDMTRIIPTAVQMLREAGQDSPRWAPRHVLVDESQDLSPVQIEMIDAISRRAESLYLVGDPDQAIYRWRGGGEIPFTAIPGYLRMAHHLTRRVVMLPPLDRSHRCPDVVAAASISLLDHTAAGASTALIGHDEGSIACGWERTENDEAATVARHISRLPAGCFRDVAVLARTHSSIEPVFFRLVAEQVPVRMMKADDPAMRQMLDRIATLLRISLSPQDSDAAKAILRMRAETSGLGIGSARKVEAMLSARESAYQTFTCLTPAPGLRRPQVETIHQLGVFLRDAAETLRKTGHVVDWLDWIGLHEPEALPLPELDLEDVAKARTFAARLAVSTGTPQRFLDVITDGGGGDRVSVGTFHAAKGRQWSDVFVVGLTRSGIEGLRARASERLFADGVLDGGDDGERRLLHVAMTRAARQVVLTWSGGADNASRYVQETGLPIPDGAGVPYRRPQVSRRMSSRIDVSQQLSLF